MEAPNVPFVIDGPETTMPAIEEAETAVATAEPSEEPSAAEAQASAEPSPPETSTESTPELAELLAEAEQRGYLRGRNEAVEVALKSRGIVTADVPTEPDNAPGFLTHLRPSFWNL